MSALHWLIQPDLRPLLEQNQTLFLVVVFLIIFAESGLLIGFFLPGDSMLFTAGLVTALAGHPNPALLAVVVFAAATLGDQTGYLIGKRIGPSLYDRRDGRIFKRDYVTRSRDFFERHGGRAVVLARFVPVVRTFTPVVAGISRMHYRTFVIFNLIGAAGWALLVTFLGFFLGRRFPGLEHYLTPVVLIIVLLSISPAVVSVAHDRQRKVTPTERPG